MVTDQKYDPRNFSPNLSFLPEPTLLGKHTKWQDSCQYPLYFLQLWAADFLQSIQLLCLTLRWHHLQKVGLDHLSVHSWHKLCNFMIAYVPLKRVDSRKYRQRLPEICSINEWLLRLLRFTRTRGSIVLRKRQMNRTVITISDAILYFLSRKKPISLLTVWTHLKSSIQFSRANNKWYVHQGKES